MLGERNRTQTSGMYWDVTAKNGKVHRGRLIISGDTATFEEDNTHFRVSWSLSDGSPWFGDVDTADALSL